MISNKALLEKIRRIKLIIMDVDGVLTDGRIIYTNTGDEVKSFDVKDGFGIRLAHRAGIKTAILTGRSSQLVLKRAEELEIEEVYQNAFVKAEVYKKILANSGLQHEEIAYIGDDIVDLPVMKQVGLSVAVPEAMEEVKQQADYITNKSAGKGAVREIIEIILKTQNLWEEATQRYF